MSGSGTIRQTVVRVGVELVNKGVQFFFLIFVARLLGATDFGAYTFALAWATVFTLFTELGLHTIATREIAVNRERASHIFGNALVAKAFLMIAAVVVFFATLRFAGSSVSDSRLLWLAFLSLVLASFTDLAYALFRATDRVHVESWLTLVGRLGTVAAAVPVLLLGGGVWELLGVTAAVHAAVLFGSVVQVGVRPSRPADRSVEQALRLIKKALPIGFADVFLVIYFRVDTVMIGFLAGQHAVGLYSAAHRGIEAFLFIPSLVMSVLLPVFSRLHQAGPGALASATRRTMRILVAFVFPISVAFAVHAPFIIDFIYGAEYRGSSSTLKVMGWSLVFIYINFLLKYLLVAIGRERVTVVITGAAALSNVVINLVLIPPYGIVGAAVATLIAEIVLMTGALAVLRSRLPGLGIVDTLGRIALAGAAMFAVSFALRDTIILSLVLGTLAYGIAAVLVRAVPTGDVAHIVKSLWGPVGREGSGQLREP